MKMRIDLVVIVFLMTIGSVAAQTEKGTMMVTGSGSYYDGSSSTGANLNASRTSTRQLFAGVSFQYFVLKNVYVGVGMEFERMNQTVSSTLIFFDKYLLEGMDSKSNNYVPGLVGGYYLRFSDRFSLNLNLKLNGGFLASTGELTTIKITGLQSGVAYDLTDSPETTYYTQEAKSDYSFFDASLTPEFNYFVSDKVGLYLAMGGVDYVMMNWKFSQSTWAVNFNNSSWRLGVKYRF